jgi:hypothetical protein
VTAQLRDDAGADLRAAEQWFTDRGLPWFVDPVDERVRGLLAARRVWLVSAGIAVVAVGAGIAGGGAADDVGTGVLVGAVVAIALLLGYAGGPLRLSVMARWAARQVVAELNLLLPLVTRALPLLLLFMTFLFVNTEVWQVASTLPRTALYGVVLLFSAVGVAFLMTRLPEEVRAVRREAAGTAVARACEGTPLEARARQLAREREGSGGEAAGHPRDGDPLTGTQQANLLLVLLVTQALQVLLLAVSVFGFFLAFGLLAIRPEVVRAWTGEPPHLIVWDWRVVTVHLPVSAELYQVSVFLSAFAGLYFTVYAVSDAQYREQFFAEISRGLERAVGVREVYRTLRAAPGAPVPRADSASDQTH